MNRRAPQSSHAIIVCKTNSKLGIDPQVGRSVVFSDESEGRHFALHTIVVNSAKHRAANKCRLSLRESRVLQFFRGAKDDDEETTRITWTQY